MTQRTMGLTEQEVRDRLKLCTDKAVLDELYAFGQTMLTETVARFRVLDTKAASMAAFGGAAITLLVSSSGSWQPLGNQWTAIIALSAGLVAFLSAFFSVRAMALREVEGFGEREWLEESCLSSTDKLKQYRIVTIWGVMNSRKKVHLHKAKRLKYAQIFLLIAVFLLLVMLFQIAWVSGFDKSFRLPGGKII